MGLRFLVHVQTLAIFLAGCASLQLDRPLRPKPDDWPAFARSATRTNATDVTVTPPLTLEWSEEIGGGIGHGSPLVIDSVLLVGNLNGDLYAIHCITGKAIGSVNLGEAMTASPLVSRSIAFVALSYSKETLVAYDLQEGKRRWQRMYGDIEATPLLYEGRIYLGNSWGSLLCIELQQGDIVWQFDLSDNRSLKGIRSSPAADDGTVVFGADDGAVYALDLQTGKERWRTETGAPIAAPPSIETGRVYIGNTAGHFYALDLNTGEIVWTFSAGTPMYSNALLVGGQAIVCTLGGAIYSFDARDGRLAWKTDIGSPMNSGPVAAGEYLYVGTLKKELCSLRLTDGKLVWKTTLNGRVKTAPAVAYRYVFVATDDRTILAFRGSEQ
jgi:outer membrane protein assembly factor BamB